MARSWNGKKGFLGGIEFKGRGREREREREREPCEWGRREVEKMAVEGKEERKGELRRS